MNLTRFGAGSVLSPFLNIGGTFAFFHYRERPFDFYGGRGEILLWSWNVFLRAPEPGFLLFAWYGPGLFGQDRAYKNKQKSSLYIICVESDLGIYTRLIKCLLL